MKGDLLSGTIEIPPFLNSVSVECKVLQPFQGLFHPAQGQRKVTTFVFERIFYVHLDLYLLLPSASQWRQIFLIGAYFL